LVLVLAAVVRVATGGQDPRTFLLAIGVAIVVIAGLVGYGYLRLWNATVYCRNGRIGVTNAFGLKTEVAVNDVDKLKRAVKGDAAGIPDPTLEIVLRDRRRVVRFTGADRLEPGGLERVASKCGLPIEGSWPGQQTI
jgi:hypothetical protein